MNCARYTGPYSLSVPVIPFLQFGYCGGVFFFFPFSFGREMAPSPGLLWHDSYTAGPLIFPLNADLHFSGYRRGSSKCMYGFHDDAEVDDDFYAGVGVILNEWM